MQEPLYKQKFNAFLISEGIKEFETREEWYREFGLELDKELDILKHSGFETLNLNKLFDEDEPQMFNYYAFIPFYPDISDGPQKSIASKEIKSGKDIYYGDVKIKDRDSHSIESARNYGIVIFNDTVKLLNIGEEGGDKETGIYREMLAEFNGTIRPNAVVINNRLTGDTTRIPIKSVAGYDIEFARSAGREDFANYPKGVVWLDKDAHIQACRDEFDMFTKAILKDWNYITGKFDHTLFGFEDAEEGLNKIINQMRKGLNEAIKNSLLLYTEEKRAGIQRIAGEASRYK